METFDFLGSHSWQDLQPFVGEDCSAGMEYELQVAVGGAHDEVDLPISIKNSTFYKNIRKRSERGDLASSMVEGLDSFIFENENNIWENSWVRFHEERLSAKARSILHTDFLADKSEPAQGKRSDVEKFYCIHRSEKLLRLPISYLLKLSLADCIGKDTDMPMECAATAESLLTHLVSDNTSPEILSFTICHASHTKRIGDLAAAETARTFLVSQLLVQYANKEFGLEDSGQKCHLYFAPHAPHRQKRLNDLVPDGYYRHLFMSPCLSGWDRGEEKHHYMGLCHKTLSRSQLNTIGKLKDAGILTNNLVTLPNTSNTCLANNGTHVSLGSKILTRMARDPRSGFSQRIEKNLGDLSIKIIEHFLPLFVGSYSAAPYRIDFSEFHPENVLGYLPHELDYTHLRMIWRRWKKKAKINVLGKSFTPFGPKWLDDIVANVFRLKGDLVPDFRLVDYLVSLLSTESCPGLDGSLGNHERLKEELMEMGVFDVRMSIYLLYRQRMFNQLGYSGFEGRSYSLFPSIMEDMSEAVDMQSLITALAYKYILEGSITHADIPDVPSVESERRQIFFGSAIGIPTFYVRANTGNRFLKRILTLVSSSRKSKRYKNYLRINNNDFRLALITVLREDGADIIEKLMMEDRLNRLVDKLTGRIPSAHKKLVSNITRVADCKREPLKISAEQFNAGAEVYFRNELKKDHLIEAVTVLIDDCMRIYNFSPSSFAHLEKLLNGRRVESYLEEHKGSLFAETADVTTLRTILHICLVAIHNSNAAGNTVGNTT